MKKYILLFNIFLLNACVIQAWTQTVSFSTAPDSNANTKSSFSSAEFIYATLSLGDKTVKEFFRLPEKVDNGQHHYIYYTIEAFLGDQRVGQNIWNYAMIREEDHTNKILRLDVLPDPAKATTVIAGTEKFDFGLASAPLYQLIGRKLFGSAGNYKVIFWAYSRSIDVYGTEEPRNKWPTINSEFNFAFSLSDVPALLANQKLADIQVKENAFKLTAMPAIFKKPFKVIDQKLSHAKIAAILKRDLPHRTTLKINMGEYTGAAWRIHKNSLGIPLYRYLQPSVHVVYKMNGKCHVGTVDLHEPYVGGGKYGALKVQHTSAGNRSDNQIACKLVK